MTATGLSEGLVRRAIFLTLVALTALAVAGSGVYWWTTGRYIESTENAYVEADIAVIAPRVAGYIRTVHVDDNQAVRAGDPLVTLEDTDYRARVAAAEAELAAGRSAIGTAEAMTASRAQAIREAQAALAAAQAEAVRAEADASAVRMLADMVGEQALVMSYADCFFLLAVMFAAVALVPFLLKRPPTMEQAAASETH